MSYTLSDQFSKNIKITDVQSFFGGSTSDKKITNNNITDDIIIDDLKKISRNSAPGINDVLSILVKEYMNKVITLLQMYNGQDPQYLLHMT